MFSKDVVGGFALTKGIGIDADDLIAFEKALIDARINKFNLIPVSSVLPAGFEELTIDEFIDTLEIGDPLCCVLSKTNTIRRCAGVAIAIPKNKMQHGMIAEATAENLDALKEKLQKRITALAQLNNIRDYTIKSLEVDLSQSKEEAVGIVAAVLNWYR